MRTGELLGAVDFAEVMLSEFSDDPIGLAECVEQRDRALQARWLRRVQGIRLNPRS